MTRTETALAVFNQTAEGALTYSTKKGDVLAITAEGALFKGGAALTALKDAALDSALIKAGNGRYRAAADIMCAAFPAIGKSFTNLNQIAWSNKTTMGFLIGSVLAAKPGKSGEFSKRQAEARMLANALVGLPAFKPAEAGEVVGEAKEAQSA